jgi:hypothetical protein
MAFKKKAMFDSDIEIEDIDTWRGEPDLNYSHELLVMEQYRRCLKAGSQEMKKGWEERKVDKAGSVASIKTHPDTRKEFGECIECLKNAMIGHIQDNPDIVKKIKDLFDEKEKLLNKYIALENEEWEKIPANIKYPSSNWMDRWEHIPNTLNFDHIFGEKYLQESVGIYRRLLEEITLLMHRTGYFKGQKL